MSLTYKQIYKQWSKKDQKWVLVTKETIPKDEVKSKKMRKIIKDDPYLKSVFDK